MGTTTGCMFTSRSSTLCTVRELDLTLQIYQGLQPSGRLTANQLVFTCGPQRGPYSNLASPWHPNWTRGHFRADLDQQCRKQWRKGRKEKRWQRRSVSPWAENRSKLCLPLFKPGQTRFRPGYSPLGHVPDRPPSSAPTIAPDMEEGCRFNSGPCFPAWH